MSKRRKRKKPRQKKSGTRSRSGTARQARGETVEVLEHESGLRLLRSGRVVALDKSQMAPEQLEGFRARFEQYARDLPRLVADEESRVRGMLRSLPTLPVLATLALDILVQNPDTYVEAEQRRIANELEWLTRVALELPEPIALDHERPVLDGPAYRALDEALSRLYEYVKDLLLSEHVRHGRPEPSPLDGIRARSRLHLTTIRSLSYEHQRIALLQGLFGPFERELEDAIGFTAGDVIRYAAAIAGLVNGRMQGRLGQLKAGHEDLRRAARAQGLSAEAEIEQFARYAGMAWLASVGYVDWIIEPGQLDDDVDRARSFLDRFSRGFGQPQAPPAGPVLDLLDRPLVALSGDQFFCHLFVFLTDAAKRNLEDALHQDQGVWDRYQSHRASFLEQQTAQHLSTAMPSAELHRNLRYESAEGTGELDLLVRLDRIVLLCECKAGSIPPPQRQGDRLRRALRGVLGEAHSQALRARRHIHNGGAFSTQDGDNIAIDAESVDHFFVMVATLDDVSSFVTNLAAPVAEGIFEAGDIPWAVSVTDLELIADMVDLNVLLPHYLVRRARIASQPHLTAIEEMDWFMHFVNEGLYFADDLDALGAVSLGSFTQPMDDYYEYISGPRQKPAPKPQVRMRAKYRTLIRQLEAAAPPGWASGALLLAHYGLEAQDKVLRELRAVTGRGAPAGRAMTNDTESGRDAVILFGAPIRPGRLRSAMRDYARAKMARDGIDRAIVIGVNQHYRRSVPQFMYIDTERDGALSDAEVERILRPFRSTQLRLRP